MIFTVRPNDGDCWHLPICCDLQPNQSRPVVSRAVIVRRERRSLPRDVLGARGVWRQARGDQRQGAATSGGVPIARPGLVALALVRLRFLRGSGLGLWGANFKIEYMGRKAFQWKLVWTLVLVEIDHHRKPSVLKRSVICAPT